MSDPPSSAKIRRLAREVFGFTTLRDGQQEAIHAVTHGRDTLAVMTTGSGKSAIYEIAGLLLKGATVVVSPLISLQRDQIENIEEELPGEAAALDGSLRPSRRREFLRELASEELEYLFLAPEQLARRETVERLSSSGVSLLVVDEAHCISEWGHDFRPAYLRLGTLVEELGRPTVLALTATASPPVRAEIVERLRMDEPELVVRGFDRPNIRLSVVRPRDEQAKRRALLERAAELGGPGIVYTATRKLADELAGALRDGGVRAQAYHAGMSRSRRGEAQAAFMRDGVDVMVATTAFGMGVDKPNVRFVFHHDPSDSIDSYYQEIGRAGRNGQPAEAVLFYRAQDLGVRSFFAAGGVDGETVERVAALVAESGEPLHPEQLHVALRISGSRLMSALSRLEDAGAVAIGNDGKVLAPHLDADRVAEAIAGAARAADARRSFDRSRLEMMRGYAEHEHCRRNFILTYFGEDAPAECGYCDNCEAGHGTADPGTRPFPVGGGVIHRKWGPGLVQRYDGVEMVVLFDSVGYKTLSVEVVIERELLEPAR